MWRFPLWSQKFRIGRISVFGNWDRVLPILPSFPAHKLFARASNQRIASQIGGKKSLFPWTNTFLFTILLHLRVKTLERSFDMVICSRGTNCRARRQHPDLVLTENNFRNPTRPAQLLRTCNLCRNKPPYSPRGAIDPNRYCSICRRVRDHHEFVEGCRAFRIHLILLTHNRWIDLLVLSRDNSISAGIRHPYTFPSSNTAPPSVCLSTFISIIDPIYSSSEFCFACISCI